MYSSNTPILKLIGVRRVKKEVDENCKVKVVASKKFVFKHGIENPLVQYLMTNHPCLLGKVLSMRYYEKQENVSEFVVSLLNKSKSSRDLQRKRSFTAMSKSQSTFERRSSMNDKAAPSKMDCNDHSTSDCCAPKLALKIDASLDMVGHFDHDVITEEESMFLMDVLEEIGHDLGNQDKNRIDSTRNIESQCVSVHHDNSDIGKATDDLVWLTNEMETEYLTFLKKGEKIQSSDTTSNLHSIIDSLESREYNHRAYLSIGRGNRCDLGVFESAVEASTAYDAYALSRRLVGLKVMQEYRVRKRVKARRYSYEATQASLNCFDEESVMNAAKDTLSFNFTSKYDANFTSDRILYPETNNFPLITWKIGKASELVPKVLGLNNLTEEQLNTKEMKKTGTEMQEQIPSLAWLKLLIDDLFTPICDEKAWNDPKIEEIAIQTSKNRLAQIMYEIIPEYEEVIRLARLEESGRQFLIDEQNYIEELFDALRSL